MGWSARSTSSKHYASAFYEALFKLKKPPIALQHLNTITSPGDVVLAWLRENEKPPVALQHQTEEVGIADRETERAVEAVG